MEYRARMASMVVKGTRMTEMTRVKGLLNGTGTEIRPSGTWLLVNPWRGQRSVS
jgi:hypothetical protein